MRKKKKERMIKKEVERECERYRRIDIEEYSRHWGKEMRRLKHLKIMVKKRRRENESGKGKPVEGATDVENRNNVRERAVGNTEK